MAEPQGAASYLWSSLKHTISLRKSQDVEPELKKGGLSPADGHSEVLSGSQVDDLPPLQLQNGSTAPQLQPSDQPEKEARKSSSWIRRLSVRRRSSEMSGPAASPAASGRLASGELQLNGNGRNSVSTSSADLGRSSKQNGLHTNSVAPNRQEEGSGNRSSVNKAAPGSREAFLEDYDAATLELCNRLAGTASTCIADTAFQEVAPWNREPGYLVGPGCVACLNAERQPLYRVQVIADFNRTSITKYCASSQ